MSAVELARGEVGELVAEDFFEESVFRFFEEGGEADEAALGIAAAEAWVSRGDHSMVVRVARSGVLQRWSQRSAEVVASIKRVAFMASGRRLTRRVKLATLAGVVYHFNP